MSKQVNVLIKNENDKTAAQEAYEKCFYEISEILVEKEISVDKNKIMQSDKIDAEDHIDLDSNKLESLDDGLVNLNLKK